MTNFQPILNQNLISSSHNLTHAKMYSISLKGLKRYSDTLTGCVDALWVQPKGHGNHVSHLGFVFKESEQGVAASIKRLDHNDHSCVVQADVNTGLQLVSSELRGGLIQNMVWQDRLILLEQYLTIVVHETLVSDRVLTPRRLGKLDQQAYYMAIATSLQIALPTRIIEIERLPFYVEFQTHIDWSAIENVVRVNEQHKPLTTV